MRSAREEKCARREGSEKRRKRTGEQERGEGETLEEAIGEEGEGGLPIRSPPISTNTKNLPCRPLLRSGALSECEEDL